MFIRLKKLTTILGSILGGGGPAPTGDMLKSVYDTDNSGNVDSSQTVTNFATMDEDVNKGQFLYIVDPTLPLLGVADASDRAKRPAVAVASATAIAEAEIEVVLFGFIDGIDTSSFQPNQEVFLGTRGRPTDRAGQYVQQVGVVQGVGAGGSILFNQGSVTNRGKLLEYARDSGGVSIYTSAAAVAGSIRRHVFQEVGLTRPQAMVITAVHDNEVQQAVKVTSTANPTFTLIPDNNNNILGFTLEAAVTITNVFIEVSVGPVLIWQNNVGTLVADVETQFNLTTEDRIPIDLFAGVPYSVSFLSDDGDVVLKGTIGGDPFYRLTWNDFVFDNLLVAPDAIALNGSTGVVRGGSVSFGTTTTVNVLEGRGQIVDVLPAAGNTVELVEWDTQTVPIVVAVDGIFVIFVDNTGVIVQIDSALVDDTFDRDNLILGFVNILGGAVILVRTLKTDANEPLQQFRDLLACLGTTRCDGIVPKPDTGLQIVVTAGELFARGAGTDAGSRLPNTLVVDPVSPAVFDRWLGVSDVPPTGELNVNTLNPGFFDDGTTIPAAIGGSANQATIQYVYKAPVNSLGLRIMYGQNVYATVDAALAAAPVEAIQVPTVIADNFLLAGRIVCRSGGTDVTDPLDFTFLAGAKFGASIASGSVGGSPGGGDFFGPASSTPNEIVAFADPTGKVGNAGADISVSAGVFSRVAPNSDLNIALKGTGAFKVFSTLLDAFMDVDALTQDLSGFRAKTGGVSRLELSYNKANRRLQLFDAQNNLGLYGDTLNNRWSLGGTTLVAGAYALFIDSIDGAFRPPELDNAAEIIVNAAVADGSMWWNSERGELKVRVGTSAFDIIRQAQGFSLTAQPSTVDLSFKNQSAVIEFDMEQNTTFTFSDVKTGSGVLLVLSGNFTPTFPAEFEEQTNSLAYDPAAVNQVWIYCVNSLGGSERFVFSITRSA